MPCGRCVTIKCYALLMYGGDFYDGCGSQDDLRKLRIFDRMGTGLILHVGGCVEG